MSNVFLSHSHTDKSFTRKLANDLRLAGHGVWIDEAEINIGDSLIEKIREGLDQVDYVIAILSSSSISSTWVTRELDIASNREIDERKVIVLPILIEQVDLPGFLRGKFYGDFISEENYQAQLDLLLRKLGQIHDIPKPSIPDLEELKRRLKLAEETANHQLQSIGAYEKAALHGKSESLKAAIISANQKFPLHAPINATHAFEALSTPVTLDYLLYAIGKAERQGTHPLEMALQLDNKWPNVNAMLSAYREFLDSMS